MSLEMEDYQKSLETLQNKLSEKEKALQDSLEEVSRVDKKADDFKTQIEMVDSQRQQAEERALKMKAMLVKTKKELAEAKKQIVEQEVIESQLKGQLESATQEAEQYKVQVSSLTAESQGYQEQLRSSTDSNRRAVETLESKLSKMKAEWESSKLAHEATRAEFESYKTRVHSVLKQQKTKSAPQAPELENSERTRLEQGIEQLKSKLQEANDKCSMLQNEYDELESEHERLTARHSKLIQDIDNKEAHWKDRFERLKSERSTTNEEHLAAIRHMTLQKESVAATFKEKLEVIEGEHRAQLASLQQKLTEAESKLSKLHQEKQQQSQQSIVRSRSPPDLALQRATEERRPGEGMDQSELAETDSAPRVNSTPTTPVTPTMASTLEKILSPTSPTTPTSPRDEALRGPPLDENLLLSNIATANKKVEHLTELLRESEANSMRLSEQAKVLKEEIRRLERNQEREKESANLEYMKNVILQFLKCRPNEREHLVPVLTTMLKLSQDEKDLIVQLARGAENEPSEEGGGWSSYVYRWTSFT